MSSKVCSSGRTLRKKGEGEGTGATGVGEGLILEMNLSHGSKSKCGKVHREESPF